MGDIRIDVTGLSELLTQVAKLPKDIQDEVDAEILDSVFRINGEQKRLAPKDQGGLARSIGFERKATQTNSRFDLYANSEHAGYMEFGTKFRVKVPAGLEAIASEMRGRGIVSKLKAKEAIYAWCKRVGLPERAWYPVFIAIMTIGVTPHPFFFGPFFKEAPKLLQRIGKIVSSYSSKPVVINPGEFTRTSQIVTI